MFCVLFEHGTTSEIKWKCFNR